MLTAIGPGNLDGITLHTYTHGASPALITSEEKMNDPRFANLRYHFRTYQDFMAAVPQSMRGLPVYITETNQGDQPWENANTGWVRAAYAEIDRWNRANTQKIRSFLLYRWPQVPGDRWGIEGKAGVIEDFRQALGSRFQWSAAEDAWTALRRRVTELEAGRGCPFSRDRGAERSSPRMPRRSAEMPKRSPARSAAMKPAELRRQFDALEAQIGRPGGRPSPRRLPVGSSQIVDKIGKLAAGPPRPIPCGRPAASVASSSTTPSRPALLPPNGWRRRRCSGDCRESPIIT